MWSATRPKYKTAIDPDHPSSRQAPAPFADCAHLSTFSGVQQEGPRVLTLDLLTHLCSLVARQPAGRLVLCRGGKAYDCTHFCSSRVNQHYVGLQRRSHRAASSTIVVDAPASLLLRSTREVFKVRSRFGSLMVYSSSLPSENACAEIHHSGNCSSSICSLVSIAQLFNFRMYSG